MGTGPSLEQCPSPTTDLTTHCAIELATGIFGFSPEPHIAFCPIFVHPLFTVFEPHIQKWVIFVRRRPCVCDTLRFESPPLRGKKIEFGTDSLLLPRADYDS